MKHFFIHLLRTLLVLCALFYCDIVVAQPSPAQCLGNIQKRLDELGSQTDFDYLQMRDIMKKFDFGEISFAVADPNKAKAFKRVITSLSEFCDAAGNSLSAKGMKGYTRTSGVLIRSSDEAITQLNLDHLKAAFTRNGTFKGSDFSKVMEVIPAAMNMFPMQCPRCHQGHDLHAIRVDGIEATLFVCHECDATWSTIESIGTLPTEDYESYLRQKGIDPIRACSEIIDASVSSAFDATCRRAGA